VWLNFGFERSVFDFNNNEFLNTNQQLDKFGDVYLVLGFTSTTIGQPAEKHFQSLSGKT